MRTHDFNYTVSNVPQIMARFQLKRPTPQMVKGGYLKDDYFIYHSDEYMVDEKGKKPLEPCPSKFKFVGNFLVDVHSNGGGIRDSLTYTVRKFEIGEMVKYFSLTSF